MTLATKITVFRIFLIPVIIVLLLFPFASVDIDMPRLVLAGLYLPLNYFLAFIVFVTASVTDFVDGYIARKTNTVSTLGIFLDPIADKMLVNATLIMLATLGIVPALAVVLMVLRDIFVDTIRLMAVQRHRVIAASKLGKVKTVTQMVAISLALLLNLPFEAANIPLLTFMIWTATLVSIVSGVDYFIKNKDVLND